MLNCEDELHLSQLLNISYGYNEYKDFYMFREQHSSRSFRTCLLEWLIDKKDERFAINVLKGYGSSEEYCSLSPSPITIIHENVMNVIYSLIEKIIDNNMEILARFVIEKYFTLKDKKIIFIYYYRNNREIGERFFTEYIEKDFEDIIFYSDNPEEIEILLSMHNDEIDDEKTIIKFIEIGKSDIVNYLTRRLEKREFLSEEIQNYIVENSEERIEENIPESIQITEEVSYVENEDTKEDVYVSEEISDIPNEEVNIQITEEILDIKEDIPNEEVNIQITEEILDVKENIPIEEINNENINISSQEETIPISEVIKQSGNNFQKEIILLPSKIQVPENINITNLSKSPLTDEDFAQAHLLQEEADWRQLSQEEKDLISRVNSERKQNSLPSM